MSKPTGLKHWIRYLTVIAISIFLSTPSFSYTCGIDNYGFIYTCCAQYKCSLGIGNKCSTTATPGSSGSINGYTTPTWMKTSACTTSPGWQASTVCTIPLGNSLVTTPCLIQQ